MIQYENESLHLIFLLIISSFNFDSYLDIVFLLVYRVLSGLLFGYNASISSLNGYLTLCSEWLPTSEVFSSC